LILSENKPRTCRSNVFQGCWSLRDRSSGGRTKTQGGAIAAPFFFKGEKDD